jgi:Pyruvate/2-oxoacid:ferredoxin oxidoreductase delta subunit
MMKWLSTIRHAEQGKLQLERMELDETGFPRPTGEMEELGADSLILALGQEADLSLLEGVPGLEVEDGVVRVGPDMMTGHPGIFAGGDMVPAERTVTVGVGHGKRAARNIDAWLRGADDQPPPRHELATFDLLNTWYYADAPRTHRRRLELARRESTFDETVHGLDESTALYEARRCLSCGNCFSCDNCYGVCPDNAVLKLSDAANAYAIDLDYCRAAESASRNAPAAPSRWTRRRPDPPQRVWQDLTCLSDIHRIRRREYFHRPSGCPAGSGDRRGRAGAGHSPSSAIWIGMCSWFGSSWRCRPRAARVHLEVIAAVAVVVRTACSRRPTPTARSTQHVLWNRRR